MPSAPLPGTRAMTSGSGSTNRITRQPSAFSAATAGLTIGVSRLSSFQPSSEVKAPGGSGTSVHCSGRTSRTISSSRSSG